MILALWSTLTLELHESLLDLSWPDSSPKLPHLTKSESIRKPGPNVLRDHFTDVRRTQGISSCNSPIKSLPLPLDGSSFLNRRSLKISSPTSMSQITLLFPQPSIGQHTASLSTSSVQPPPQSPYPPSASTPAPYESIGHEDLSRCKNVLVTLCSQDQLSYIDKLPSIVETAALGWKDTLIATGVIVRTYQAKKLHNVLIHFEYRLGSLLHSK